MFPSSCVYGAKFASQCFSFPKRQFNYTTGQINSVQDKAKQLKHRQKPTKKLAAKLKNLSGVCKSKIC